MTAPPLSGRWAAPHHRALSSAVEKAPRLAIALGAVRSIIRVVDRGAIKMDVDWAAHDPDAPVKSMSYTNFQDHQIRLNPSPILDPAIDHGIALDTVIGFGLHEASHSQESRDRYKYLIKRETVKRPNARPNTTEDMEYRRFIANPTTVFDKASGLATREVPAFEPMRIAAYLWNLIEDVRIERATSKNWPGFAPYFGVVLDYMWTEMRKHHEVPTVYGPTLTDKLRVIYLACRYPGRADGATSPSSELTKEIVWWQAWQHDYLSDAVDTPTTIQRGLDHLAEDPATAKELEQQVAEERKEREAGERLRAQLDRLVREGTGAYDVCVAEQGEVVPLDDETAEEVRRLVRENLVEHVTVVTTNGVSNVPVRVRKPTETAESRRAYVGRPDAQAEALRAALVFRASAPMHDEKLLKDGRIDDEELWRWGAGDMRVFSERVIESKPDVFLALLVDISGSMYAPKLTTAQRLAQLFVWALHDQEGVETAVWAHTADVDEVTAEVYRIWQRGDPLTRLGLLSSLEHSNNRDHQALEYVVGQVALVEQPQKVVVVLSDGLPQARGLGGSPAHHAVRNVVRWAANRGVRVVQLAIDPHGIRPADQAAMYDSWIGFRDYASLPRQLTQLMGRFA